MRRTAPLLAALAAVAAFGQQPTMPPPAPLVAGPGLVQVRPNPVGLPDSPQSIAADVARKRAIVMHQRLRLPVPVFVRVHGPAGAQVTWFGKDAEELKRPAPLLVGLRSRHLYPFAFTALVDGEELTWFGSVHVVRGPDAPPEGVSGDEAPVAVHFNDLDVVNLAGGQMLTKVIVLEDPDQATAVLSPPDEGIVYEEPIADEVFDTAKRLGEIVAVVRIGNRIPTRGELAASFVPGSMLWPRDAEVEQTAATAATAGPKVTRAAGFVYAGTKTLTPTAGCPAYSPPPAAYGAAFDPGCAACPPGVSGAATFGAACPPAAFSRPGYSNAPAWPKLPEPGPEYLCDGGDRELPIVLKDGVLINIDSQDTVAAFRTLSGVPGLATSNRVCIYAPRFVEVQARLGLEQYMVKRSLRGYEGENLVRASVAARGPERQANVRQSQRIRMRQRPSDLDGTLTTNQVVRFRILEGHRQAVGWDYTGSIDELYALQGSERLLVAQRVQYAVTLSKTEFPMVLASGASTGIVRGTVAPSLDLYLQKPPQADGLKLLKMADKTNARPGETVAITLKYTNVGDRPLADIAVIDSLTTRLEFVEGSEASDRDAVFSATPNDVSSLLLRWEIQGVLPPGESGTVRFDVIVR